MAGIVQLSRFRSPPPEAPWWIVRKELIPAPPERVWHALTDPLELAKWWCDVADVRLEPDGHYSFGGRHVYGARSGSDPQTPRGEREIVDIEPGERLTYRWPLFGVQTQVRYEIVNELESTRLTVTQTAGAPPGWDPGPGPSWWWVALPALRTFIEKGVPDLRIDFASVLDAPAVHLEVHCTTFPWILWHKLTEPTEIRRWWAPVLKLDPRAGGEFRLEMARGGPSQVLAIAELKLLAHDWLWPGGTKGRVEWRLEETESDVRLGITDLGPWDPEFPRDACALHWGSTLLHLKQLSERGITPREYQDG